MATNKSFTKQTGGLEVAKTYSSHITGKTILITGVSPGGIGEATARAFAHGGASIIIATGRDKARVEELARQISAVYPSTKFRCVELDLASLETFIAPRTKYLRIDRFSRLILLSTMLAANLETLNASSPRMV
ncbi:hypothetical protein IG631_11279 [Alternaria alternata]|nr:hypothetical protein IG631_11279 [Alternaria alternata]